MKGLANRVMKKRNRRLAKSLAGQEQLIKEGRFSAVVHEFNRRLTELRNIRDHYLNRNVHGAQEEFCKAVVMLRQEFVELDRAA